MEKARVQLELADLDGRDLALHFAAECRAGMVHNYSDIALYWAVERNGRFAVGYFKTGHFVIFLWRGQDALLALVDLNEGPAASSTAKTY